MTWRFKKYSNFFVLHKWKISIAIGLLLLIISIATDTIQTTQPSLYRAKHMLERKIRHKQEDAEKIVNDTIFLRSKFNYAAIEKQFSSYSKNKDLFIYVYQDGMLKYWSNNEFIPENIEKIAESKTNFIKQGNGFYCIVYKEYEKQKVQVFVFIPVYYHFLINNQFLRNGFVFTHPFLERFVISSRENKNIVSVNNMQGNYLFSIRTSDNIKQIYNPYTVFIELLGLLLLFWALYRFTKQLLKENRKSHAILLILCTVIFFEVLFNQLNIFSVTKTSQLFASTLFASPYLGDSLGVLLIRTFLVTWCLSFLRYFKSGGKSSYIKVIFPIIFYLLLIFVIQSIILNSVISFNFYYVNSVNIYTFISLVIFGLCFSGFLFVQKWAGNFQDDKKFVWIEIILTLVIFSFAYIFKLFGSLWYTLFLMLWFISFSLFYTNESSFFKRFSNYSFLSNLILLAFISFLTSIIIIYNTNQKDIDKRKYRMKELIADRDHGEEFNLTEAETEINNDKFIDNYFKNPYIYYVDIEDRITDKYFKRFQKRYSINVYTFDKDGLPLKGLSNKDFYKLNAYRFSKKAIPISNNFYYLAFKENGEKYLGFFPMREDTLQLGYLFVEFTPKIFSSFSAYPELLMKQNNYFDEEFDNYAYGIYDQKHLVKQKGDYEYKLDFNYQQKRNEEYGNFETANYNHLVYFGDEKQVVLSEQSRPALSTISIFSYMIIFFLLFFIFVDAIGFSDRFWGNESIRNFMRNNTLQKQIQNAMIALVLVSLVIIGIVTLVYFQYQYNLYHNSRLLKKVNTVMKNVSQYYVDDYPQYKNQTFNVISNKYIKSLSNIHALDINVYDSKGELLYSTQPEIFKRQLLSNKMDADAYYNLVVKNKSKYVHDESIGKLKFLSAYQPFRSNGKVLGYYNFPYYGKEKSFREDISYFLVALVNVYVIFLIAAALLAIFLSRSITNSLKLISDNIKNVQFGKSNQPIFWKNQDEIGLLVKQYNLMLAELEKSAGLLAKSEREGAWREMAKQVAHEIKNPLTPMKLSIQHLQRAINDNSPDIQELTKRVSERLIEQIDNLSNIASAFSDFAKMPVGNFEKIDIVPLIKSTVELFGQHEEISFEVQYPEEAYEVLGDKNQIIRVFTNIIKNSVQAIPENGEGKIKIDFSKTEHDCLISIFDNGTGIPEDKRDKIFEPNFTTKSSGTGLGLAICKNTIERMEGKIWFVSKEGEYTIFYLEFPLYKNDKK